MKKDNNHVISVVVIILFIITLFGYIMYSSYTSTNNKINECNKLSECDRLGCLANNVAVTVFQTNTYLLQQQNCILKQIQNEKETQTN